MTEYQKWVNELSLYISLGDTNDAADAFSICQDLAEGQREHINIYRASLNLVVKQWQFTTGSFSRGFIVA